MPFPFFHWNFVFVWYWCLVFVRELILGVVLLFPYPLYVRCIGLKILCPFFLFYLFCSVWMNILCLWVVLKVPIPKVNVLIVQVWRFSFTIGVNTVAKIESTIAGPNTRNGSLLFFIIIFACLGLCCVFDL